MRKTPACKAMDTYFTTPLAKNKETQDWREDLKQINADTFTVVLLCFLFSTVLVSEEKKNIRKELSLNSHIARL